jgi:CubicO group peptidase (beta-lactamase class C family)
MVGALERANPRLRPGGAPAYHALTFGWLAGEIVQRVAKRPLVDVVRTEIAEPLGLVDMHIGSQDPAVRARLASLGPFGSNRIISGLLSSRRLAAALRLVYRGARIPVDPLLMQDALIPSDDASLVFDARVLDAPVPAANGLFTARALARMYAALANGGELQGVRLVSAETLARATAVQTRAADRVLVMPMHWRLGYHSPFTTAGRLETGFGHFGYGGSGAWADPRRELAFAMVNNRLGGGPFGDLRIAELGTAALRGARAVRRSPRRLGNAQPVY